jgi:hypothetical protein
MDVGHKMKDYTCHDVMPLHFGLLLCQFFTLHLQTTKLTRMLRAIFATQQQKHMKAELASNVISFKLFGKVLCDSSDNHTNIIDCSHITNRTPSCLVTGE